MLMGVLVSILPLVTLCKDRNILLRQLKIAAERQSSGINSHLLLASKSAMPSRVSNPSF